MMTSRVLFFAMGSFFLVQPVFAQTLFFDDFSDRTDSKWTHRDLSGDGVYDASSGSYHIHSNGPVASYETGIIDAIASDSFGPEFSNGTISFTISPDALNSATGTMFRMTETVPGVPSTYVAQLITDPFGQSAVVTRIDVGVPQFPLGMFDLGWVAGGVYNLEVTFSGPEIAMTVWEQGTERPNAPQIEVSDSTYSAGGFGLYSNHSPFVPLGEQDGTVFDDVRFEAIPEPASATLLLSACIALARRRRRLC